MKEYVCEGTNESFQPPIYHPSGSGHGTCLNQNNLIYEWE